MPEKINSRTKTWFKMKLKKKKKKKVIMEYQHATLYHELCRHVLNWSQLGIKMITLCCISTQWKWYVTVGECCCIAEWLEHCRLAEEQKSLKEGPDGNRLLHSSLFCCSHRVWSLWPGDLWITLETVGLCWAVDGAPHYCSWVRL